MCFCEYTRRCDRIGGHNASLRNGLLCIIRTGVLQTDVDDILIEIKILSFKEIYVKIDPGECRIFRPDCVKICHHESDLK